jgi:hypothetical protein
MSEPTPRPALPEPAPGFPGLVAVHLRLLVRESRLGMALLAVIVVALPLTALVSQDPGSDPGFPLRIHLLLFAAMGLTGFLVFLWPEAVWRGLGPGRRMAMDAFPVSRRSHRMARVAAGAVLPLVLAGSLILSYAILANRGLSSIPGAEISEEFAGLRGMGIVATALWALSAYAFSTLFALRFGKVFVGLLVTGTVVYAIPLLMVLVGLDEPVMALGRWAAESRTSPFRFLLSWFRLGPSDVVPGLAWLAVFGGASVWLAGRHDKP